MEQKNTNNIDYKILEIIPPFFWHLINIHSIGRHTSVSKSSVWNLTKNKSCKLQQKSMLSQLTKISHKVFLKLLNQPVLNYTESDLFVSMKTHDNSLQKALLKQKTCIRASIKRCKKKQHDFHSGRTFLHYSEHKCLLRGTSSSFSWRGQSTGSFLWLKIRIPMKKNLTDWVFLKVTVKVNVIQIKQGGGQCLCGADYWGSDKEMQSYISVIQQTFTSFICQAVEVFWVWEDIKLNKIHFFLLKSSKPPGEARDPNSITKCKSQKSVLDTPNPLKKDVIGWGIRTCLQRRQPLEKPFHGKMWRKSKGKRKKWAYPGSGT